MKINISERAVSVDVLFMLIDHFGYSIKDINSYDELTEEEKNFISRDTFDKITE